MLKKILIWAFKDELLKMSKNPPKRGRKKYEVKKRHIAYPYDSSAKALKVNGSFIISSPKMVKHKQANRFYGSDYVSYFNAKYKNKRFSQMTVDGQLIITRIK